jgi:hypothetical protein
MEGESDIIFHQSGNFGYLIFSKEKPIYIRGLGPGFFSVVEVAPHSVWFWTNVFDRIFGLSLIEIGLIVETFTFRRYIQLIPKGQIPNRSRITIYTFCCIVFSSVVYIIGTSFFSLNDNTGFTVAVGVGVTLFVGLLRYSI